MRTRALWGPVMLLFPLATLLVASPVAAGTLKVTSFPSGAQVTVDGVNTGKVTPMNVALSDGDHIVKVEIPGSGWSADTRVVTIVAGNNDLSVTLLPTLTTGPRGPDGPQGPQGPQGLPGAQGQPGAPGAPATVRAATSAECATGGIVVASGDGLVSLPVCNGAQGAQGLQGIQGIRGETGPAGPSGPAGGTVGPDPTTIVGFGTNVHVTVGNYQGQDFGLSPVFVELLAIKDVIAGRVSYLPGSRHLAPFAIAARQTEDAKPLQDWFESVRDGHPMRQTVSIEVSDIFDKSGRDPLRLKVVLAHCLPTALAPPQFGSSVSVSVTVVCDDDIQIPTIIGGDAPLHDVGNNSPLLLAIKTDQERIADVTGGGERVVGFYTEIEPLVMYVGTRDSSYKPEHVIQWVLESLGIQSFDGSPFRDIELRQQSAGTVETLATYRDVLLTGITLIDPTRVVELSGGDILFRVGFGLSMQATKH